MSKFLEYVAKDMIAKYGNNMADVAVVFPNKRAALFLNEQLAKAAGQPIWAPAYYTISEFFRNNSSLTIGDPIKLTCDLHKSFVACTGIDETLDHFYGWGQLLLADFDDIDKNMADAAKVFSNVSDLHQLDDLSYLTEEQKALLRQFFINFTDSDDSQLKQRFMSLWCHFHDIYRDYHDRLHKQGIAYEGMLYQEVAEHCSDLSFPHKAYLFVGFNVIQQVEQRIFSWLHKQGKAHFYWDFDRYYMPKPHDPLPHEAGCYISQYLQHFPNELDNTDGDIYDNMAKPRQVNIISATTENIQARYISQWLRENDRYQHGKDTAIVLCNENLLPVAIHCFPQEVDKVNITTGFPLSQASVSSFISQYVELKTYGYSAANDAWRRSYVVKALSHPYTHYMGEDYAKMPEQIGQAHGQVLTPETIPGLSDPLGIFEPPTDNMHTVTCLLNLLQTIGRNAVQDADAANNPLFQESVFRAYTLINRLGDLIAAGDLDVDGITLQKLIVQLMASTSIPFHGEPAEGIQLMGVLETRNLDFDHILVLSCNEGNMPKGVNDSSFIPYSIRKAYGLTTIDNKVAIYAYYFYNLLQRCHDITLVYNNATDSGNTGEMSRFMLQLLVESNYDIRKTSLQAGQQQLFSPTAAVDKDPQVMKILHGMTSMSPTAINRYMRCPLMFYYNHIADIKEPEEDAEGMDNRTFGNIFHLAAEMIYGDMAGKDGWIRREALQRITKDEGYITRIVDRAFAETIFGKGIRRKPSYNGLQLINREVIVRYISRLLEIDKKLAPFRIIALEKKVYTPITFTTSEGEQHISVGGYIDRLDKIHDDSINTDRIRVIDYKTGGSVPRGINTVDDVFEHPMPSGKHTDYYLQAMLYSCIVRHDSSMDNGNLAVSPALLFIQHTQEENYDPTLTFGKDRITDILTYEKEFMNHIKDIIAEIFEPNISFLPTEDERICSTCPYRGLCNR